MIKKIGLLLLMAFCLSGCQDPFLRDFPYMKDQDHLFIKVDFEEGYRLFSEGTQAIVLAYNSISYSCPYCQLSLPLINKVAQEEKIEVIYYLDIYQMRTNNTSEYQMLLSLIDSQVDDLQIRNDQKVLLVPDIYFIVNGKIVSHHIATFYDLSSEKYLLSLTEEEKLALEEIYRQGFRSLK